MACVRFNMVKGGVRNLEVKKNSIQSPSKRNMDANAMTVKSDDYGFRVVLLQLLTGRGVYDRSRPSRESNMVSWVRPFLTDKRRHKLIMDARLKDEYPSFTLSIPSSFTCTIMSRV
ncbi:hypothetical protein RJ639_035358 [Escallonia herrerae]|uniref:Uncharacterized protein n=1 Tax=Escallonia herrerae TaxID=1293975 RepID=A0AA89BGK7_9ASTE|nr:hypothetical protein RJ639_035358 [Escallonia herrerae]